eukprot:gene3768-4344_t
MSSPIASPVSEGQISYMDIEPATEQEYIVFCIDLDEEISSIFKQTSPRLDHIKKALSLFVRSKLRTDPTTKFAICTLRVSAIWHMNFTSDFQEVRSKFDGLKHGGRFNAFDMTTLFDTIEATFKQISESKYILGNNPSSAPSTPTPFRPWNLRVIFIYSRSSIIPQYLGGTTSLDNLKKSPRFSFESIYMYHSYHADHSKIVESIGQATKNISKISDQSSIRKFYYCFLGILFVPPSQRPTTPKYIRFPVGLINENLFRLGPWGLKNSANQLGKSQGGAPSITSKLNIISNTSCRSMLNQDNRYQWFRLQSQPLLLLQVLLNLTQTKHRSKFKFKFNIFLQPLWYHHPHKMSSPLLFK